MTDERSAAGTVSRIAVIGAGRVGRALGARWSASGFDVVYGVRDPADPRHADLQRTATTGDAARGADVVVIALPWAATQEAVTGLDVGSAVILDATNPLAANARELVADPSLAGAQLVSSWIGSTRVVKAFNCTGSANMATPDYPGQQPMMPVAGDDATAKIVAIDLARTIGFDAFDAGPLTAARDLEHLAVLWIRLAYQLGNGPDIAFGLLRR